MLKAVGKWAWLEQPQLMLHAQVLLKAVEERNSVVPFACQTPVVEQVLAQQAGQNQEAAAKL
jgi:hypothetical protein